MTEVPETAANPEGTDAPQETVPAKKPRVAVHARHVARSKRKPAKRAAGAKRADKAAGSAKAGENGGRVRHGSKTEKVVGLLKRPGGATGTDLMKATGWQAHSVRGFISGVLGRRMGLKVKSEAADGQRRYSLRA
jgi:hypothetical protein